MAKNKAKRGRKRDEEEQESLISPEALKGVWAVLLIAFSLFLILAAFNIGGQAGSFVFWAFEALLGIGYMLLPLSLILLSIALFRSFERSLGLLNFIAIGVFLLSTLGLVSMAFPSQGGIVGASISGPLVSAVDTIAAVIFLVAFTVASLVIAFNIHIGMVFSSMRDRMRREEIEPADDIEEASISGIHEEDDPAEEVEDVEEDIEETPQEPRGISKFFKGSEEKADVPTIASWGGTYTPPPIALLGKNKGKPEVGDVKANMNIIKRTLQNFNINVEMDEVSIGPTVTRYAMKPAEDVRISKIVALQSNLELALAASPVRIEAPIPGKSLVGIEVPNISRTTLGLGPLVSDSAFSDTDKPLMIALGRSISGSAHFADLARMPHMLVAGATGAGKSVAIHDFVISLLYRAGPQRLRFIMVDPKRVELTLYNSIPHLLTPVITDAKKAILALKWLGKEMERRYNILEAESVRDIASYHTNVVEAWETKPKEGANPPEPMPYIVVIIDELADIMQTYPRELEAAIVRLAQMSRAVGIHLVLSTQRPSVKVITGLIKANIPARVALQVASQIDSRTILDTGGAEKLLGAGDMLFLSGEMNKPRRIQAPYISESEVKKIVEFVAKENPSDGTHAIDFSENKPGDGIFSAGISDDSDDDDLYEEAKQAVLQAGKASTSYLQRKLRVGYARAARLVDLLEERGVIGPADGAKPRDVIGAQGSAEQFDDESPEGGERY